MPVHKNRNTNAFVALLQINKYARPPYSLRGLHVTRQQKLSIDICCPRPTSAANLPAAAAAVVRRDIQTDRRTLDRFITLNAVLCRPTKPTSPTK